MPEEMKLYNNKEKKANIEYLNGKHNTKIDISLINLPFIQQHLEGTIALQHKKTWRISNPFSFAGGADFPFPPFNKNGQPQHIILVWEINPTLVLKLWCLNTSSRSIY